MAFRMKCIKSSSADVVLVVNVVLEANVVLEVKTAAKERIAVKIVARLISEPGHGSKRCKTFFSVHSVSSGGIGNSQDCGRTGESWGPAGNRYGL